MPTRATSSGPIDATRIEEEMRRRPVRAQARAMPDEAPFICDTLRLARLCQQAMCRRADRCCRHPLMCLDTTGERVPAEAFDFAVQLAQARQDGEPAEDLDAEYPAEALAYRCWIAALDARVTRDRSRSRQRAAPPPPGSSP
jgi:hypothetical protein